MGSRNAITPTKFTAYTCFALFFAVLSQSAFGQQEYTAEDSSAFQQSLANSRSDSERINYQLELAEYSIRKPGSLKTDLDNAKMWIDRSKKLNEKLRSKEATGHILLEEGYLQQEYGPSPEGRQMITESISLLDNGSDKCLLATAYKALAYYYNLNNPQELPQKIELYKQSAIVFRQCGNMMKTAAVTQHLAELYINEANFPPAVKAVTESLSIYDSIHYPKVQGLYDLLGTIYFEQADYDNALKYELKALDISNQQKDSTMQFCETNNHLGLIYYQLEQMREGIAYFKDALIIARKHNDIKNIIEVSVNIVNSYVKLHDLKDALNILDANADSYKNVEDAKKLTIDDSYVSVLTNLHQFDRARTYAEEILYLVNPATIDKYDLANAYHALIGYFFAIHNYSKELEFLIKDEKLADEMASPATKAGNLALWYKMDSARGDYKEAYIHLLEYKALGDSIFNEKKSRQIAQIRIQYETQQKEDEIRLKSQDIQILTQNAKLDQSQLRGARLLRNMTLAGTLLFILIAAMLYRRYREKQKINLLITNKNIVLQKLVEEKEWLLKEVHHRVKNNLHTIMCLLESQAAFLQNDALKAIESSQHRIYAMSLIHQRSYLSADVQAIDMAVYLREFIMYLKESFGSPLHIGFQQEIESIQLDVSQAIPLALIINESVTNAMKYAFPEARPGMIRIALLQQGDSIRLNVQDNGIGIPGGVAADKQTSLGLALIKGLTDDLKGVVQFLTESGTSVIVLFKQALIT
jgi:two-component system, sensor histidine kinase PdtaS